MTDVQSSAHCLRCGYDLMGSGPYGSCPECGTPYDRRTGQGVVSGHAIAQERGDRLVLWIKVGVVAGLGVACLAGGMVGALRGDEWQRPMIIGGGVAMALFAIAGLMWWVDVLDRRSHERR